VEGQHSVVTNDTYDRLYRLLTGGSPGQATTYTYDTRGNRLSPTAGPTTTTYSYDNAVRIHGIGAATPTVDRDGELTASGIGSTTYAYDVANRLVTITVGGTTAATYAYDGDGKRASKTVSGTTTSYVYDVNGSLPNVLTDGTLTYVYGLGLAYTVDGSGNVHVMHTDGLGSVRALTDGSGNLTQTFATDEFGNPTLTQGSATEPFRYTGQQRDSETGFYDLRARYYWPSIGRFITRDSVTGHMESPLRLNRYSYVVNNPSTATDPDGKGEDPADPNPENNFSTTNPGGNGPSLTPHIGNEAISDVLVGSYEQFGPMNPGPLTEKQAATFRSSTYDEVTLSEPVTLYRVYGPSNNPYGEYWSTIEPAGPIQAIIDSALDILWGNPATSTIAARIPAGTTVYAGFAGEQRGLVGGGPQVFIPGGIDPAWELK
jgi:RHS repeat-associated protein